MMRNLEERKKEGCTTLSLFLHSSLVEPFGCVCFEGREGWGYFCESGSGAL